MNNIVLPAELRPSDGRFGSGPSKVRQGQIDALVAAGTSILGTSHRKPPVKNLVQHVREGLLKLFRAPEGYEILLSNGGASFFWDAAALGLIKKQSANLVIGEFSNKFAKAASAPWLTAPAVTAAEYGTGDTLSAVAGADVYAWPHNETSTGVSVPIKRVAGADEGALMVVDATSAAGGIDFDASEVDMYYFSPQKNFGSDGGIWFALASPAAIARIEELADADDRYTASTLSLSSVVTNSRLQQTLNTPALATLVMMGDQIDWMLENGGLEWAAARTKQSSDKIYAWAEASDYATPFVQDPAYRSPVVATIDLDDSVPAAEVSKVLRANGIVDIDSYRKLGRNQLRIATFVAVEPSDVDLLLKAIDYVVAHLHD